MIKAWLKCVALCNITSRTSQTEMSQNRIQPLRGSPFLTSWISWYGAQMFIYVVLDARRLGIERSTFPDLERMVDSGKRRFKGTGD